MNGSSEAYAVREASKINRPVDSFIFGFFMSVYVDVLIPKGLG